MSVTGSARVSERGHPRSTPPSLPIALALALLVLLPLASSPAVALADARVISTTQPDSSAALQALAPTGVGVMLGPWNELIQQAALETGVPWQVIGALLVLESKGDPAATSPRGDIGLMQLRAAHWTTYAGVYGDDPWDPWTNIRTAAAVLADGYARWGSWERAVASYIERLDSTGAVQPQRTDEGWTGLQYLFELRLVTANLGLPIAGGTASASAAATQALQQAMTKAGSDYVWGGASDADGGYDCSGLVQWAYAQAGVTVPRTAEEQWVGSVPIQAGELRPGDLIFFVNTYEVARPGGSSQAVADQRVITHVGIYAGDGMMLHAPKEGDVVRLTALGTPFWRTRLAGYGRVAS